MAAPPPPEDIDPKWAAENKSPGIVASIVTVTSLSTLFTAARLYVRGWIIKKLQLDDYIILAALVSCASRPVSVQESERGRLVTTSVLKLNAL